MPHGDAASGPSFGEAAQDTDAATKVAFNLLGDVDWDVMTGGDAAEKILGPRALDAHRDRSLL